MDLDRLVGPSGIVSGVLFLWAYASGIPRLRFLGYHGAAGYAACAVALAHSVFAVLCHMIEPVGVLATIGMAATTVNGALGRGHRRSHAVLATLTLLFTALHVWVVIALR